MKTEKVQSPNFGYNKTLNSRVIKKLSSARHNKPFFNMLLEMNNLTNKTEDLMRDSSIAKNKNTILKLENMFLLLKTSFSEYMDQFFPQLKYSRIEAATYAQQITENHVKDPSSWECNITQILTEQAERALEQEHIEPSLQVNLEDKVSLVEKNGLLIKEMDFNDLPEDIQADVREAQEKFKAQQMEQAANLEEDENYDIADILESYNPTAEEMDGFAGLVKMDDLKTTLMKRVVEPLRDPEKARAKEQDYGIKLLPTGMLLYGPPGCGKTTIAKRLAVEADVPLLIMKSGKFGTAYYHGTSNNIIKAYDYAESIATPDKPVIMFFDDCDSIFAARSDRMERFETEELTTFLDVIDNGAKNNVITIGTTNRFDIMDEAIKRRLSLHVQIPLADVETRIALIDKTLSSPKGQSLKSDREAVKHLAEKFEGYSNDTIIKTMKEALMKVCDESDGERDITLDDVLKIMDTDEFKNKKVDMRLYETKNSRKAIGFASQSTSSNPTTNTKKIGFANDVNESGEKDFIIGPKLIM